MSIASRWVRWSFARSDAVRDAGLATPDDVVRYDGLRYGDDPQWQTLDVYRPRSGEGRMLPVIVSVHGGGWVYGDKDLYQFYCMSLAQRGFSVINFSYRLAPEHKFPAPLEDTNAVFRWVLDHAAGYGFDRKHIFAVGDSAGANILGLYCAVCADPGYAAGYEFQSPDGFIPTAVALNCGLYRIRRKRLPTTLDQLLARDFLPKRGSREELGRIDVAARITGKFPPAFVMTANGDFLREQAPPLCRALEAKGVAYLYRCYGDDQERLGHVFHCDCNSRAAKRCNDEECTFFMGFL